MITREQEDYLKAIYHLQLDESPVRTTTIARYCDVKPASVTGVIQRLADLDMLNYTPYQGVTLTHNGRKAALEIIRNHRLIELYLIEALGYTWDEVHDEAERLEHAVSPLFIERISKALGHPKIDPHGAPIPTKDGHVPTREENRLSELESGSGGIISRVDDHDPQLLRYLADLGIRPGAAVNVKEVIPYGGSLKITVDGITHALGSKAADHVFVEALTEQHLR